MNKRIVNALVLFFVIGCMFLPVYGAEKQKDGYCCPLRINPIAASFKTVFDLSFKIVGIEQDHIWFLAPEIPTGVSVEVVDNPEERIDSVEVLPMKEGSSFTFYRITDVFPINAWSTVWKKETVNDMMQATIPPGWYRMRVTYSLSGQESSHVCCCWSQPFRLEDESKIWIPEKP